MQILKDPAKYLLIPWSFANLPLVFFNVFMCDTTGFKVCKVHDLAINLSLLSFTRSRGKAYQLPEAEPPWFSG